MTAAIETADEVPPLTPDEVHAQLRALDPFWPLGRPIGPGHETQHMIDAGLCFSSFQWVRVAARRLYDDGTETHLRFGVPIPALFEQSSADIATCGHESFVRWAYRTERRVPNTALPLDAVLRVRVEDLRRRGFNLFNFADGVLVLRRPVDYADGVESIRHRAGWREPLPAGLLASAPEPVEDIPVIASSAPVELRHRRVGRPTVGQHERVQKMRASSPSPTKPSP